MSGTRHKIAKDFLVYAGSFVIMQGINLLLAFYTRHRLGPEKMGVWVVLQIFLTYTKYTTFGIGRAAVRDIPFYKGRGDHARAAKIRNISFTFVCVSTMGFALVILILALVFRHTVSPLVFYTSLVIAVVTVFQRVTNLCIGMLRAEKEFTSVGKYNVYSAIFNAAVTFILIERFNLYGYYAAMIFSLAFNLFYIPVRSRIKFGIAWDWQEVRQLLQLGFPLLLINFMTNITTEVDRISIGLFMHMKSLGIYSLVAMAGNLIYTFPSIIGIVTWPYLTEAYGADSARHKMQRYLTEPSLVIALYIPILIGVLWAGGPWAVHTFLRAYDGGIFAMKIGMFLVMIELLAAQMAQGLITYDKYLWMIPVMLVVGPIAYGANWIAATTGLGINGIAVFTLLTACLTYAAYTVLCLKQVFSVGEAFGHLGHVFLPACYYLAGFFMLDLFWKTPSLPEAVWRTLGVLIIASPMLLLGEKKFKLFQLVWNMVRKKWTPAAA